MYDLLIKGGKVIDPAQQLSREIDVAIHEGKVAELRDNIAPSEAKEVLNARGLIVTPGLIDMHCHVSGDIVSNGLDPDKVGVLGGVTTLNDAGSTGYANFKGFKRYVIPGSRTDVFCFLHICSTGIAHMPEIWSWHDIDVAETLKTIEGNRDIIKGVKIRAVGSIAESLGVEAIRTAKKVAKEARLPLMVHLGLHSAETTSPEVMRNFVARILPLLDAGDIINHIYTYKPGGVIFDNHTIMPEFREAIARGVARCVRNR